MDEDSLNADNGGEDESDEDAKVNQMYLVGKIHHVERLFSKIGRSSNHKGLCLLSLRK